MNIVCNNRLFNELSQGEQQLAIMQFKSPIRKILRKYPNKEEAAAKVTSYLLNNSMGIQIQYDSKAIEPDYQSKFIKSLKNFYSQVADISAEIIKAENTKRGLGSNNNKDIDSFNNSFNSTLISASGINDDNVSLQDEETTPLFVGEDRDIETQRNNESLEQINKEFYTLSINSSQYRDTQFKLNAFRSFVAYPDKLILVTNELELNKAIAQFKNNEYNKILTYLNSIGQGDGLPSNIYNVSDLDIGTVVNTSYLLAMNRIYKVIKGLSDQDLGYRLDADWRKAMQGENAEFLDAVNAYVNLQYFDTLLKDSFGDVIDYNKDEENAITDIDVADPKYKFGQDTSGKSVWWGESEFSSALDYIGKFSKIILGMTPLKSYYSDKSYFKTLTPSYFIGAINQLFDVAMSLDEQYYNFKDLIVSFHNNPRNNAILLFNQLFDVNNESLRRQLGNLGLNNFNLDVLYSVYDFILDNHDRKSSIINLEKFYQMTTNKVGKYNIVDTIAGMVDRNMDTNYIQSTFNKNKFTTSIKAKGYSNQQAYNIQKAANQNIIQMLKVQRQYLNRKYSTTDLSLKGEHNHYIVDIDGFKVDVTSKDSNGVLGSGEHNFTINSKDLQDLFNNVDLSSTDTINDILSHDSSSTEINNYRKILTFFDDILGTEFLSLDGLNSLFMFQKIGGDMNEIFQTAFRGAVINKLYLDFLNNTDRYADLRTSLLNSYNQLGEIEVNDDAIDNFFLHSYGVYDLRTVLSSMHWPGQLSEAQAILDGSVNKAQTKDLLGNSIGNYRTAFMGGNYRYYINRYRQRENQEGNTALTKLLFTDEDSLIKGVAINTDTKSRKGISKRVRDLQASDLYYNSIFSNFFNSLITEDDKNKLSGKVLIQPTTYSDKTAFLQYIIDIRQAIYRTTGETIPADEEYDGVSIYDMTEKQITRLAFDTIGKYYKQTLANVLNDYAKIFNSNGIAVKATVDNINNWLHTITLNQLVQYANKAGVKVYQDTHYRKYNKNLKFNELLDYYANNLYKDINNLKTSFSKEKLNFLNDLLRSNTTFYTTFADGSNTEIMDIINKLYPAETFKSQWIRNGKLVLAKVDGKDVLYGTPISTAQNIELNPLLNKWFYIDSILSNNLRLSLTGSEIAHPDKFKPDWLQEAKDVGINITQDSNFTVDDKGNYQFDGDYIKLKNLSASNPAQYLRLYNNIIYKIANVSQGTQLKRNVIIPATLQYVQQGALNGLGNTLKCAVIQDVNAKVFNFNGISTGEDAHDGSGFQTPLTAILLNQGLQDQEVGWDMKPIWHDIDENTGSASLFKYACYAISNARCRASLNSDINLYNLLKRMYDLDWQDLNTGEWNNKLNQEINLTDGIDFGSDILKGNNLYYSEGTTHRQILNLGYEKGTYYTDEMPISIDGMPLSGTPIRVYHWFNGNKYIKQERDFTQPEGYHKINSLWQLFQVLGGINSQSMIDGRLQYSEASNFALANYVNNVRFQIGDQTDFSQNSYYQPLKDLQIGYAINSSAVKNGAAQVNTVDKWKNGKLSYMEMHTDGLGIQMDADHEIEESELTEFSQVISALEAGGRLHNISKQIYQDLGHTALLAAKIEDDAVNEFVEGIRNGFPAADVKSKLYDVIARTIINNFKIDPERVDLAQSILTNIAQELNIHDNHKLDPLKIPLSDNTIYGQILSSFVSSINRKAIKRKYPGSGCVMVPGYHIIQTYNIGDGQSYMFDDILQKAIEWNTTSFKETKPSDMDYATYSRNLVREYLNSIQSQYDFIEDAEGIAPAEVVNVVLNDTLGIQHIIPINLENPEIYYKVKDKDIDFIINYISKNNLEDIDGESINKENGLPNYELSNNSIMFQTNVVSPRDLQPQKIKWKYKDKNGNEREMSIFDMLPIRLSFFGHKDNDAIQQVFNDLYNGKMYAWSLVEGKIIKNENIVTNIYDLQNTAAEMVMSNLYANKFGTGHSSLAYVMQNKQDFFLNKLRQRKLIASTKFDFAFSKGDGRNTYISLQPIQNSDPKYAPEYKKWEYTNRQKLPNDTGDVVNDVYVTNKDNQRRFLIGQDILRKDLMVDDKKVINVNTGKIVADNIDSSHFRIGDNNQVLEYIEFISPYKMKEQGAKGKILYFNMYQINKQNISRIYPNQLDEKVSTAIRNIFEDDSYLGIQFNDSIRTEDLKLIRNGLNTLNTTNALRNYINRLNTDVFDTLDESKDTYFNIDRRQQRILLKQFNLEVANEMWASFQKSLYFTSSRIPAQSLQSFMQMKLVGFANSDKNIIYVSHFQTFLQGSDYDIDKAYVMGNEFDANGKFIGWSNLFDYSSIETLEASTHLKTPKGIKYYKANDGVDITTQIDEYAKLNEERESLVSQVNNENLQQIKVQNNKLRAKQILILADILERTEWKVNWQNGRDIYGNAIIEELNNHESTQIPENLRQAAFKNSISTKIQYVVQDLRNVVHAYQPIEMDNIRAASENTDQGSLVQNMNMMNPLTKYNMQLQNMVGKKVISIAAVGEKVFFTISYFWNEGIRSNDEQWKKDLKFSNSFIGIEGRANKVFDKIKIVTTPANINFDGVNIERLRYIDDELRQQYGINDGIIAQNKNNKQWIDYHQALINQVKSLQSSTIQADLQISEILSAATDNAKELILYNINCNTEFAKHYLYLTMMGFNINDIVAYMTSPTIKLINDFMGASINDPYIDTVNMNTAIAMAQGKIDYGKFLRGSGVMDYDDYGNQVYFPYDHLVMEKITAYLRTIPRTYKDANGNIVNGTQDPVDTKGNEYGTLSFHKMYYFMKAYMEGRLNGNITAPLNVGSDATQEMRQQVAALSDYVENIISKIKDAQSKVGIIQYYQDLDQFIRLNNLANETTTLGNTILGLNQGLPTSKIDVQRRLHQLQNLFIDRLNALGINESLRNVLLGKDQDEDKQKKVANILENVLRERGYTGQDFTRYQDIILNFNIDKWFMDEDYRQQTIKAYNLVKGTWNVFSIIEHVPQYKAIFQLFKDVYITDNNVALRSQLINLAYKELLKRRNFISEDNLKAINKYISDLLITNYINNLDLVFPVMQGEPQFDKNQTLTYSSNNKLISLSTPEGRATFKAIVEQSLIPMLKSGKYRDIENGQVVTHDLPYNQFVQGLRLTRDSTGLPQLKSSINLISPKATPSIAIKFADQTKGLYELNSYRIQGKSITDWLAIYNLIVNQNQWGAERLTPLFKTIVDSQADSILNRYFAGIGEIDYNQEATKSKLYDLGFNIDDLEFRLAPIINRFTESRHREKFVQEYDGEGNLVYKKYNDQTGEYEYWSPVQENNSNITEYNQRQQNYHNYFTMQMPEFTGISRRVQSFQNLSINELTQRISDYIRRGVVKIYIQNC